MKKEQRAKSKEQSEIKKTRKKPVFPLLSALCSLFSVHCSLFIVLCSLLIGCEGDPDFLKKIDEEIAWANADRLTVAVTFPPEWGSSNPQQGTLSPGIRDIRRWTEGQNEQKYKFSVEFTPLPGFGFEGWLAFPTSDYARLNKTISADDIEELNLHLNGNGVEITNVSGSNGVETATVIISTNVDVTLVPWCTDRPRITHSNPPLISSGFSYTRGQQITITFSMQLDYEDKEPIEFGTDTITISGQGLNGVAWNKTGEKDFHDEYFNKPYYDEELQSIIIKPIEESEPPELYNITVTVFGKEILGKNGKGFSAPVQFSYITSKELVTLAYKASNIWASHDPEKDRRVESFFYQTAPSERDRRLRPGENNSGYTVSLFFSVSRSMGEIVNPEPNALTIVPVYYADLDGTVNINELEHRTVNYKIDRSGSASVAGTNEESGTFIPMNTNESSAGGVYRQMNNISHPLDVNYYEVIYTFSDSPSDRIPSGIYRLVLLPYQADGDIESYKDLWDKAVEESRYVTVVIDKDPPNTDGSLLFSGYTLIHSNGAYRYTTDSRFMTITPDFINVSDNGKDGGILPFQATPNIPWTMDENKNLFWKYNITFSNNTGNHEVLGSDWLPVGTAPSPFDLARFDYTSITNENTTELSNATVFYINVRFRDSLRNESVVNENEEWKNMGRIIFTSPPPALPPQRWKAVYNDDTGDQDNGEIIISWTTPDSMLKVNIGGGSFNQTVEGTGERFRRFIVPRSSTGIQKYDITLTAINSNDVSAPPVSFTIFNAVGGMEVDADNPAFEINTAADLISMRTTNNEKFALGAANSKKQFVLTNNISTPNPLTEWTPIGDSSSNSFQGKFYGNGRTITISSFSSTTATYFGLFGYVNNALIRDLIVNYTNSTGITITGTTELRYVGGIAAIADGMQTEILNSTVRRNSGTTAIPVNIPAGIDVHSGSIVGRRLNNPQIIGCSGVNLNIIASATNNRSLNHWLIDEVINTSITNTQYTLTSTSASQPSQKVKAIMNIFIVNNFNDTNSAGTIRHALANALNGEIIRFSGVTQGTSTVYLTSRLEVTRAGITIEGNGITLTRHTSWDTHDNTSSLMFFNLNIASTTNTNISRIHFKDGRAWYGGAIYNWNANVTLESCIFTGNNTTVQNANGGAIGNNSTMTIRGCTFFNNGYSGTLSSTTEGGAISNSFSAGTNASLTLIGNLFYGNRAGSADLGHVVHKNSQRGTVTSQGNNIYDAAVFVTNPGNLSVHSTDRSFTDFDLIQSGSFIPTENFRPHNITGGVTGTFTRPNSDYPTHDFYGNQILTGTNAALIGAVQTSSGRNYYIVNNFNDVSSQGTLRHALTGNNIAANTIIVFSGVINNTLLLQSELPDITKNMTIEGNGIQISRSISTNIRLLTKTGGNVTIRRVLFRNGKGQFGGAIFNDGGDLTLESCIFSSNETGTGTGDNGGAIDGSNGTITVKGCTFYNNNANRAGGGAINMSGGSLILAGNLFYGNKAANGSVVNRSNVAAAITSHGYNVFDSDPFVRFSSGSFTNADGDARLSGNLPGLGIPGFPINTSTFAPVTTGRLHNHIPAPAAENSFWARDNMPPVDFYGNVRTWPGPPGAVQH